MNEPWLGPILTPLPPSLPGPVRVPRRRAWRYVGGTLGVLVYILPEALAAMTGLGTPAQRVADLITLALFAPALPYISYRKRDCLLLLVPLWGFAYAWQLGWRLALLPYRDWRPREDEMTAARSTQYGKLWTHTP